MRKNKIKFFILLTLALYISKYPLDIFANPSNDNSLNHNQSTILDGEIGEWDPTLSDNPNFDGVTEIEGSIPNENEYYTISVTVPVNMEFYVLPSSSSALGNFYSPTYNIKNNGSKTLITQISCFGEGDNSEIGEEHAPLYVEKVVAKDRKTQIELRLNAIDNLKQNTIVKDVDLTNKNLENKPETLYELHANEVKGIKFAASKWDLPQIETDKESAMSNFRASFIFAIKQQNTGQ